MSCDDCKYEWRTDKEANKYCKDCDEYTHDKHTKGATSWFGGFVEINENGVIWDNEIQGNDKRRL